MDVNELQESINQYESQLSQLQAAMAVAVTEEERSGLASLCRDIVELIALTKENLQGPVPATSEDPLDQEYLLFKAALGEDLAKDEPARKPDSPPDIKGELRALEGMKCQAPYKQQYGHDVTYHNAMVTSIDSASTQGATDTSQIQVRVVFVNPIHQAMRLCPYYLDGKCRFTDDKCRYSHGQLVPLSDLKEYKEPDFSQVRKGSRVLALASGELWRCACVQDVELSNGQQLCHVKYEDTGEEALLELHSVLPLEVNEDDLSDNNSSDDDINMSLLTEETFQLTNRILMNGAPSNVLGAWEQHTRGIGSKLMAKMGYITGAGLGIRGEGKVEPVEACILPPGKSLDHCMRLKALTGDKDLFKVEKKERRQRLKLQKQQQKKYEREKARTSRTVFDFINSYLISNSSVPVTSVPDSTVTTKQQENIKSDSRRSLNVKELQLCEEIRRAEREVTKLGRSVSRLTHGNSGKAIHVNLKAAQVRLDDLKRQQRSVEQESSRRRDRQKMTSF